LDLNADITLTEGQEFITTDVITGNLNSIIIESPDKVDIIITSEHGYPILKSLQFQGIKCFAPRNRTTSSEEHIMDVNQFDKFLLNERIEIIITGPKNSTVRMILRTE